MTENLIAKWTVIILLIAPVRLALLGEQREGGDPARSRSASTSAAASRSSTRSTRTSLDKIPPADRGKALDETDRHDLAPHRQPGRQGAHRSARSATTADPHRGAEDDRGRARDDQGPDARARQPRVSDRHRRVHGDRRRSTSRATGPTSSRGSPSTRRRPRPSARPRTRPGKDLLGRDYRDSEPYVLLDKDRCESASCRSSGWSKRYEERRRGKAEIDKAATKDGRTVNHDEDRRALALSRPALLRRRRRTGSTARTSATCTAIARTRSASAPSCSSIDKFKQDEFAEYTGKYLNKPMALALNDEVWSAPTIEQRAARVGADPATRAASPPSSRPSCVNCLTSGSLRLKPRLDHQEEIGPALGDARDQARRDRLGDQRRGHPPLHDLVLPVRRARRGLRPGPEHLLHPHDDGALRGDPEPARDRRHHPLGRHGRRREHPRVRAHARRDAEGQAAAPGRSQGGYHGAFSGHLRRQRRRARSRRR